MKGRKYTSIVLTVLIATFLWTAPVWASEQDTGYPWFADITEDNQTTSQSNTIFHVAPVLPSEQDTGYPWFADIEEDKTIMKPVTTFKAHPRTVTEDTGYPWFADTKEDNKTGPQPSTTTR